MGVWYAALALARSPSHSLSLSPSLSLALSLSLSRSLSLHLPHPTPLSLSLSLSRGCTAWACDTPRSATSSPRASPPPASEGSGFRVQGSGFRVQGSEFRVKIAYFSSLICTPVRWNPATCCANQGKRKRRLAPLPASSERSLSESCREEFEPESDPFLQFELEFGHVTPRYPVTTYPVAF